LEVNCLMFRVLLVFPRKLLVWIDNISWQRIQIYDGYERLFPKPHDIRTEENMRHF
jgi:hypothetical protein